MEPRDPFLKSTERFSGPERKCSDYDPLILESWVFYEFFKDQKTIKTFAKFRALKSFRFEDTGGVMSLGSQDTGASVGLLHELRKDLIIHTW